MPAVVVDIAPGDPPAAMATALLDACSAAVETGDCELSHGRAAAGAALAIVHWEDDAERRVLVQVAIPHGGAPAFRGRTLDFTAADARIERYRAVGLTIATLASEIEHEEAASAAGASASSPGGSGAGSGTAGPTPASQAQPPPGSTPEAPSPVGDRSPPRTERRPQPEVTEPLRRFWVSVFGVVGPAFSDGTLRYGGGLDLGFRPWAAPWFVALDGALTSRQEDRSGVSAQWTSVAARLGATLDAGPVSFQPTLGVGYEFLSVDVTDPATQRHDAGHAGNLALHLGGTAHVAFGRLAVLVGVDARHLPRETDIFVKDQRVGESTADGVTGLVGVRLFLQ